MSAPYSIAIVGIVLAALPCAVLSAEADTPAGLKIDDQFPGGNIILERIEGDQVHLRPDLRDTEGWWFYWCFRVRGAAGRTLTFQFAKPSPIGVRGPAVSPDEGKTWRWLGTECVDGPGFTHAFGSDERDVRFSFGMPYVRSSLDRFLGGYRGRGDMHLRAAGAANA